MFKGLGSTSAIVTFFALAYAFTWAFWIPAGFAATGRLSLPVPVILMEILGGLGPMAAAIAITALQHGKRGIGALFRRLFRARVGLGWYLAALLLIPLLELTDVVLHLAAGGQLQLQDLLPLLLIATPGHFIFVFLVGGGIDEEVGWRGFALPRLQARLHPAVANVLLGVLWSCWHLPLWFIPGSFQSAQSFPVYLVGVTAMSVLLGWIHNGTGGSLLLVVLAHAAADSSDNLRSNLLGDLGAGQATEYHLLRTGLFVLAAVVVLVSTRGRMRVKASYHQSRTPAYRHLHKRHRPSWRQALSRRQA